MTMRTAASTVERAADAGRAVADAAPLSAEARDAAGRRALAAMLAEHRADSVAATAHPEDAERAYAGSAFVNGPSASDVHQGVDATDCWLLSALMAIARTNPGALEDMVKPTGRGTYLVTYYAASDWAALIARYDMASPSGPPIPKTKKTVEVAPSFPTEKDGTPAYARAGESNAAGPELWPMLIEKAVATELGGYAKLAEMPAYLGLYLCTPDDMAVGQIEDIETSRYDANALFDLVAAAHEAGRPMICASTMGDIGLTASGDELREQQAGRDDGVRRGLFGGHAYTIAKIDRRARTISLDEPTQSCPQADVTVDEFKAMFVEVAFGKAQPRATHK